VGWRLVVSGRTKIVYVAHGTKDSPTSPSRRARATEAGKDVLRRPFLVLYMLLLVTGCSEGPQRSPVEASPEDTPTSEARTPGGKPAGPARDSTSDVPEGAVYCYTYGLATGNRVVGGEVRLPEAELVDLSGGTSVWVEGVPLEEFIAWSSPKRRKG
jgi:hypothetical protein